VSDRPLAPLPPAHPLITDGHSCAGCKQRFAEGEVTTIVRIGPGADEEARERCRRGVAYSAIGVPAHWACVTGSDDPERDYREVEGLSRQ
jgi:hypothetical protein